MKKAMIALLACFCLCSCSTQDQQHVEKKDEKKEAEKQKQTDLTFTSMFFGAGNEKGFYRITMKDDEETGNTNANIRYFDYASKKEIYLCDKPECKHKDKNCASYLENYQLNSELFVTEDHLYYIKNVSNSFSISENGAVGEQQSETSKIYQMDVDGKNKKVLCELEEGYQFVFHDNILGQNTLYIQVSKEETVAIDEHQSTTVVKQSYLNKIDLTSGKQENILDMKNRYLIGTHDASIVIQQLHYKEDPDDLLAKKDYDGYQSAALNATTTYQYYDVNTNALATSISTDPYIPYYADDQLYYIDSKNVLCRKSMTTNKSEQLIQLSGGNQAITNVNQNAVMIESWSNTGENDTYLKSELYSMQDHTLSDFHMDIEQPKESMTILAETKDQYFMIYKREGHIEDTWAGTKQFETDRTHYALINKEDYWNQKQNFLPIADINDGAK